MNTRQRQLAGFFVMIEGMKVINKIAEFLVSTISILALAFAFLFLSGVILDYFDSNPCVVSAEDSRPEVYMMITSTFIALSLYLYFSSRNRRRYYGIVITIILISFIVAFIVGQQDPFGHRCSSAPAKAKMSSLRAQAELHYDKKLSYDGVCDISSEFADSEGIYSMLKRAAQHTDEFSTVSANAIPFVVANPALAVCNDSAGAYAAETPLLSGKYFCVDSTGMAVESEMPQLITNHDYNCNP